MTLKAFRRFSRAMLGTGAITVAMLAAACGSSSSGTTGSSSSTSSLLSCRVTASELSFPSTGKATAPTASVTGSKTLSIDGSTALGPLFSNAQKSFDPASGTTTTVGAGGSGQGLKDAEAGAVQIGMSDIFAQEKSASYADLTDHQVAAVAFTLVVSGDIAPQVGNLTTQQIKDIFAGNTTDWSQIGGPSEPVNVVVRTAGSGTRATFDRYIIGDPATKSDAPPTAATANATGDLVTAITSTKGAIGYVSTGFVLNTATAGNIFPVCIDGYGATIDNINSGKYKFWSYEHAYTKGGEPAAGSAAAAFLTFVKSSDFQTKDVPSLGFLQIDQLKPAATATHPTPTAVPAS